ncbi:MAG: hypothetical protein CM15mP93_12510 [Thiotrichaceae bacterium]|nr:MAG: hypothetical protein CM15mP93_12510 [Thiotrichaceae bacterium]
MHSNILDKFKDFKKSIVFEPFIFIEISSQNLKLISKDKVLNHTVYLLRNTELACN